MGRVEEVTELLVRLVVAAGREVDDPACVPHLGEHAFGLCPERDALDIADPRLGAVDVAAVGEVDRLAHIGGCQVEGLAGFDAEPEALVEVGGHGLQRPKMNGAEGANRQGPGEQAQPALLAEAGDRRAEKVDDKIQSTQPEGGCRVSPSVGPADGFPRPRTLGELDEQLVDVFFRRDRAQEDDAGVGQVRQLARRSGDLRTDLGARVQPPASGRSELEQRQAKVGLGVLPGPRCGRDDGPEVRPLTP